MTSSRKPFTKEGTCHYHLCRKRTKVYKCSFCDFYFCDEHKEPRMTITKKIIERQKDSLFKAKLWEEYEKQGGHPDFEFSRVRWDEIKQSIQRPLLPRLHPKPPYIPQPPIELPPEECKHPKDLWKPRRGWIYCENCGEKLFKIPKTGVPPEPPTPIKILRNIPIKPIVVILIVGLVGWYLYNNPEIIQNLSHKFSDLFNKTASTGFTETEETPRVITKEIPYILDYQQKKIYFQKEYENRINDTLLSILSKLNFNPNEGWQIDYKDYPQHATTTQKVTVEISYSKDSVKTFTPNQEIKGTLQKPKSSIDITELEIRVHDLVNIERQNRGLNPLKWNSDIANSARKHSTYLASINYLDHIDKNGKYHDDRLKADGIYYFGTSAENLAMTPKGDVIGCGYVYSMDELARCTVSGWMGSSGHRQNILTSQVDETGIGVVTDDSREYYFTQVFTEHVYCGYETGPCCEEAGYYPYCYVPLNCVSGICR